MEIVTNVKVVVIIQSIVFLPRSGSVYYKPSASLFCTPVGVASRALVVILAAARISVAVLEAGADCPVI